MIKHDGSGHVRQPAKAVRKILITVLTGGTAYFFTDLSNQPQIWALTASIFIGGITLVVQFLNDFEGRLEKTEERQAAHSAEMRSLIEKGFSRTNEATELFQAVEESALQTDAITQLVRHSTQIRPDSPPLVYRLAQLQIDQMSQFLKDLSEGRKVPYDGEDRDWLLGLTMQSRHTIDATSLSTVDANGEEGLDGGLWTSDLGRRYLELQEDATGREVVIRRVFIVDLTGQINKDKLLNVCRAQKERGIHVKVIDKSAPKHDAIKSLLLDFIVFDGVIGYEVEPASHSERPTIVKTQLVLESERVKERIRRFERLWSSADEVD